MAVAFSVGCSTPGAISSKKPVVQKYVDAPQKNKAQMVRTTAYSHVEKDSLPYGRKSAKGTVLKYGKVRSAAADWSEFPVGTIFKIKGQPYVYEIDDYGSALVGTETIDIYKPNMRKMNAWGVRHVSIEVMRWGSYNQSLQILKDRMHAQHVRKMVEGILEKSGKEESAGV